MYEITFTGLVGPLYTYCLLVAFYDFTWLSLCDFGAFGPFKIFS